MDTKQNNFDKEFSLNQKKKAKPARGKLPPWLLILAGIAIIGGVIAARQPGIHQDNNGTRTTVNLPASQMVSGDHLVFNTVNDEQVNSSELEARLIAQDEQGQAQQLLTPASVIAPPPTPTVPLPEIVLHPEQGSTEEQTTSAEKSAESDKSYENAAIAWLNEKAYSVSVKPAAETAEAAEAAENTAPVPVHQTSSANVPVTVLDQNGNEKKQPQATNFELNGKEYSLELTELAPEEIPAESSAQPVVWIDTVPLQVSLSADRTASAVSAAEQTADAAPAESPIEISLNPLPEEQTKALQQERFGIEFTEPEAEEELVIVKPTETPVPEVTEEPQEENWFASFFNNLFGGDPTATPTPQITVIALSPTPTVPQPTATPLVIRMEATAAPQGPVRLDGETDVILPAETAESKEAISNDPALIDNEGEEEVTSAQPTKAAPSRIDAVVVDSFDSTQNTQPEVQPTPSELPHTGGLEGWNIPSLLIMLGGLLLVIIGVRRLRTK